MILTKAQVNYFKDSISKSPFKPTYADMAETALHHMAEAEAAKAEIAKWRKVAEMYYKAYAIDMGEWTRLDTDEYDAADAAYEEAYDEAAKEAHDES
jgi:hypothetical protein